MRSSLKISDCYVKYRNKNFNFKPLLTLEAGIHFASKLKYVKEEKMEVSHDTRKGLPSGVSIDLLWFLNYFYGH